MERIKHEPHDPEWHLNHPRTRKWMVQCSGCLRWSYRVDAPKRFWGRPHMERHFEAIDLVDGLCQQCRRGLGKANNSHTTASVRPKKRKAAKKR